MTGEWLEHETVWYVERYDLETEGWVRTSPAFAFKTQADRFYDERAAAMPGCVMRMVQEKATIRVVRQKGEPQWTSRTDRMNR